MASTVYIILPVHNRRDVTEKFVECLKRQTCQDYHLLLMDDGSTDGTADFVRATLDNVTVIRGEGKWWWAGSLQKAYEWVAAHGMHDTCVLIMNDDVKFDADFLEKGYRLFKNTKKTLMLPQAYTQKGDELHDGGIYADWKNLTFNRANSPDKINCLSTRGLFVRASDLLDIGGFHPMILPHYLSDYEFTIRAFRKGYSLKVAPSLKIWVNHTTTGFHSFPSESFREFAAKFFSKKSAHNPFYWSAFIFLACPWRWKPLNLVRVWERCARALGYVLLKNKDLT